MPTTKLVRAEQVSVIGKRFVCRHGFLRVDGTILLRRSAGSTRSGIFEVPVVDPLRAGGDLLPSVRNAPIEPSRDETRLMSSAKLGSGTVSYTHLTLPTN